MSGIPRIARPARRRELPGGGIGISIAIAAIYASVIILVALSTGILYHATFYGNIAPTEFVDVAILVAALFLLPAIYRNELFPQLWLGRGRRRLARVTLDWVRAFALLLAIGFLTKTSAEYSRAWLVLYFVVGLVALVLLESGLVWGLRALYRTQRLAPRRLSVIGQDDQIREFGARVSGVPGLALVSAWPVGRDLLRVEGKDDASPTARAELARMLANARDDARQRGISDVVILADSSRDAFVDATVDAFSLMPVAVHLDAAGLLERFGEIRLERIGPVAVLGLTAPPMGPLQALGKRIFDIAVATLALVILSPLMVGIAVLIKLDSRGPVLFRQRRLGYNQNEFRILKFRTMTTLDDGDTIMQVRRNDPRVTRVGAYLRRWNLDELPQLFNVLAGEMSVVGPRPHAVAHDRQFEKQVLAYPRRSNVMPGITGWAQVNGLRGETDTAEKLRARVEHDLYYIDNWSLGLDLYILVLTVLSARSYRNAR